MTTGETIVLTIQKVMSLLFNMLSRFFIAFSPKSKCLLISWLPYHPQWFQRWRKSNLCHCFYFPPSIWNEVMGLDAMILIFEWWVSSQLFNSPLWPSPRSLGERKGYLAASLIAQLGKESACNAGDPGSIPGLGRSPGEGYGNPLQYSCLENSMDRGFWWSTVHGVAKSWTGQGD